MATAIEKPEVDYPESDGEPMGESGWHVRAMLSLYAGLGGYFNRRGDVYVASNMFLYYEEGRPASNRCPDCMVVFGVGKHERRVFKTWVERAVPSVVFEISSANTFRNDLAEKFDAYASLGVPEYYLFDPTGECLDLPLLGYRLVEGDYQAVRRDPDGGLTSPALGLRLVPEGYLLRLIEAFTGRPIPMLNEKDEANRRLADELVEEAEARRRLAAELERNAEENRRLSEELDRLRGLIADRGTIDENPTRTGA